MPAARTAYADAEWRVYEPEAAEAMADRRLLAPMQRMADELGNGPCDGFWHRHLLAAMLACGAVGED